MPESQRGKKKKKRAGEKPQPKGNTQPRVLAGGGGNPSDRFFRGENILERRIKRSFFRRTKVGAFLETRWVLKKSKSAKEETSEPSMPSLFAKKRSVKSR